MELRHLRYFVAVAEAESFTVAAGKTLHTTQPSLSRQIHDLEVEVGVTLLTRNARGVEVTAAGKAFLDHARLALAQVEAAGDAARRAAKPAKSTFRIGFLTGQEIDWLPGVMRVLRDRLSDTDINISSQTSRNLADALLRGALDIAFLRIQVKSPQLVYQVVTREPFVVILPSDHHLTANDTIDPGQLAREKLVIATAPALRWALEDFLRKYGLDNKPEHEIDNLAMAMSLIASTRSIALLPAYAQNFMPWSVTSRPLARDVPTVELAVGYNKANTSPILKLFLSRFEDLVSGAVVNRASVRPSPRSRSDTGPSK